jgi:hypothetical protein
MNSAGGKALRFWWSFDEIGEVLSGKRVEIEVGWSLKLKLVGNLMGIRCLLDVLSFLWISSETSSKISENF